MRPQRSVLPARWVKSAEQPCEGSNPVKKVSLLLAAGFLLLAGVLVEPSVSSYMEQRSELSSVKAERDALRSEIAEINADVEGVTDYEGLRTEARCFGPYVEPGEEVYSIFGLKGCAVSSPNRGMGR